MEILPVSHEPEEMRKILEEKLSLLPEGTLKGLGKAIMAFTKWRLNGKEETVLKIKPEPDSKLKVHPPIEAISIDARPDSISFSYKEQGYLIFYS